MVRYVVDKISILFGIMMIDTEIIYIGKINDMGIFEGITHSEEIKELVSNAQSMYDSATERLEAHKKSTSKSLENLGKLKLEAWSGDMSEPVCFHY